MLKKQRKLRKTRVKSKISAGTAERPRLSIYRSNKFIYAQAINDAEGTTVAHSKGADPVKVAKEIADTLTKGKINAVVFDRSGYKYHGRIKQLAESLRESKINL